MVTTDWYDPYASSGTWYRGSTHLHTFHGPGGSIATDPAVIAAWYRQAGYRFINFSDHNYITSWSAAGTEDGAGSEHAFAARGAAGDMSKLPLLERLRGAALIELYNHRTGDYAGRIDRRKGVKYAVDIWDRLLLAGNLIWPTAVDDAHDYWYRATIVDGKRTWRLIEDPAERFGESGGGWMWVLAEQLTRHHLKAAMRRGAVYASQGPRFGRLGLEGEELVVGVVEGWEGEVRLIVDGALWRRYEIARGHVGSADSSGNGGAEGVRGVGDGSPGDGSVGEVRVRLPDSTGRRYVRVELVDTEGRRAWSSPFVARAAEWW